MMITAALNAGVAAEGTLRKVTVRFSVVMSSAPMALPPSEKRPPASEVPPMTTARIASISMSMPVLETSTVITFAVANTPAMPASRPLIT